MLLPLAVLLIRSYLPRELTFAFAWPSLMCASVTIVGSQYPQQAACGACQPLSLLHYPPWTDREYRPGSRWSVMLLCGCRPIHLTEDALLTRIETMEPHLTRVTIAIPAPFHLNSSILVQLARRENIKYVVVFIDAEKDALL